MPASAIIAIMLAVVATIVIALLSLEILFAMRRSGQSVMVIVAPLALVAGIPFAFTAMAAYGARRAARAGYTRNAVVIAWLPPIAIGAMLALLFLA